MVVFVSLRIFSRTCRTSSRACFLLLSIYAAIVTRLTRLRDCGNAHNVCLGIELNFPGDTLRMRRVRRVRVLTSLYSGVTGPISITHDEHVVGDGV
ncbi:hypothetical protein B0H13DRAFT_2001827 [Mycena leptocephala]|nr:hypothetical protein B0H13DRAFT_2001827 [Mycena leptocephala]